MRKTIGMATAIAMTVFTGGLVGGMVLAPGAAHAQQVQSLTAAEIRALRTAGARGPAALRAAVARLAVAKPGASGQIANIVDQIVDASAPGLRVALARAGADGFRDAIASLTNAGRVAQAGAVNSGVCGHAGPPLLSAYGACPGFADGGAPPAGGIVPDAPSGSGAPAGTFAGGAFGGGSGGGVVSPVR